MTGEYNLQEISSGKRIQQVNKEREKRKEKMEQKEKGEERKRKGKKNGETIIKVK